MVLLDRVIEGNYSRLTGRYRGVVGGGYRGVAGECATCHLSYEAVIVMMSLRSRTRSMQLVIEALFGRVIERIERDVKLPDN